MLSVSVFGPVEEFETKTRRDAHRFFFCLDWISFRRVIDYEL